MKQRRTVLFLANSLGVGGAEQQLLELARGVDKERFRVMVATLYPGGALHAEMAQVPGVQLLCLNRAGKYDFSSLFRVRAALRSCKVDIVQPFLTPATFFGLLPGLMAGTAVKIATERCGLRKDTGWGYRAYRKVEDLFTRFADAAVANSRAGQRYLIERGVAPGKTRVIYNGINLRRLQVHPARVSEIRAQMGLKPGSKVVGIMARLDPAKDHTTFFRSAQLVAAQAPEAHFALLGDGPSRSELETLAREMGLGQRVTFFGAQRDVANYLATFDVKALSSKDIEGCSNSLLEAMALGKPVVATDIGGNKELIDPGKTGLLVPPGDPPALAQAVLHCLKHEESARAMGEQAQTMVLTRFSLKRMVQDYETLWEELWDGREKNGTAPGSPS